MSPKRLLWSLHGTKIQPEHLLCWVFCSSGHEAGVLSPLPVFSLFCEEETSWGVGEGLTLERRTRLVTFTFVFS